MVGRPCGGPAVYMSFRSELCLGFFHVNEKYSGIQSVSSSKWDTVESGLAGRQNHSFDSPTSSKIPFNHRNLYGDRVQEAKDCVPLRAKSRLTRSRLTRFDCIDLPQQSGQSSHYYATKLTPLIYPPDRSIQ
jgi:hypothetical protein